MAHQPNNQLPLDRSALVHFKEVYTQDEVTAVHFGATQYLNL